MIQHRKNDIKNLSHNFFLWDSKEAIELQQSDPPCITNDHLISVSGKSDRFPFRSGSKSSSISQS